MIKRIAFTLALALLALAQPARAQRFMFTGVSDAEVLDFFGKLQRLWAAGTRRRWPAW